MNQERLAVVSVAAISQEVKPVVRPAALQGSSLPASDLGVRLLSPHGSLILTHSVQASLAREGSA